jgi:UMP-CMP kinase
MHFFVELITHLCCCTGKIVPVEITIDLLYQAMMKTKCNRYLIDGFPRNWDNIRGYEEHLKNKVILETVIFIDCPEEELERRVLHRGESSGL